MRKLFFPILCLLACLLPLHGLHAQDNAVNRQTSLRIFLSNGEILSYPAAAIDSITMTDESQTIWADDTTYTIPVAEIDSVWYVSPVLRLIAPTTDFGKVAVGNGKTMSVVLINTGQYDENYTLLADGVFSAAGSGHEFIIAPGETHLIDVTFRPKGLSPYKGMLTLSSAAIDDGLFNLPLVGEGVAADSLEADTAVPTETQSIEIVLPEGIDPGILTNFKVSNYFGDYSIGETALARVRRSSSKESVVCVDAEVSSQGLQFMSLTNKDDERPWLTTITTPYGVGKESVDRRLSARSTAISLLLTDPMIITGNVAGLNNTLNELVKLKSFDHYVTEVQKLFEASAKGHYTPNYSVISKANIYSELSKKFLDDRDLTKSGVSLKISKQDQISLAYKVVNNYKRVIHIYPSRVKMDVGNVRPEKQSDYTATLLDICEHLLKDADMLKEEFVDYTVKPDEYKDKGKEAEQKAKEEALEEAKKEIDAFKSDVQEIEKWLKALGLDDFDTGIQLPYILNTKHSSYWKIVKEFFKWEQSSIYETESETIENAFDIVDETTGDVKEEYDRIFIDVYGFGLSAGDTSWENFTQKEKIRAIIATLHGAYKDFIRPFIELVAGIQDAAEDIGQKDEYKYDLRYGARKEPEMALLFKLLRDFKDKGYIDELQKTWEKDKLEFFADLATYTIKTVLSEPKGEDAESKRTYANLIYNIYKKWTKTPVTSKKFREKFKENFNNITYLNNANFAQKVINISEFGLDGIGSTYALFKSDLKSTFHITKSKDQAVRLLAPAAFDKLKTPSGVVRFVWDIHMGQFTFQPLSTLEFAVITPNGVVYEKPAKFIRESYFEYDVSKLLNSHKDAIEIMWRVTVHHPSNLESEFTHSEYRLFYSKLVKEMPDFVDLGLPSGTLWATTNIGATQASDYGNYYAWGETTGYDEGKKNFSWKEYKYSGNTNNSLTKYCTQTSYGNKGFTDGITQLQGTDDPMSLKYGCYYSIPTKADWEELMTQCTWRRMGNLAMVTGRNGEHIYLPMGGYRQDYSLYDAGKEGYYWSSTLDEYSPDDAWFAHFYYGSADHFDYYRCHGRSIRPVLHKDEMGLSPASRAARKQAGIPTKKQEGGIVMETVSHPTTK